MSAEIPPIESREGEPLYTARLGFDIVFGTDRRPYIIEINGLGTGMSGIDAIPTSLLPEDDPIRAQSKAWVKKSHTFSNPPFIERRTVNKTSQIEVIPEHLRPRTVNTVEGIAQFEPESKIVIKPAYGSQGRGVTVFNPEERAEAVAYAKSLTDGFVAQEYIPSKGADRAPAEIANNAAALRVGVDYQVLSDGSIKFLEVMGYQRVSAHAPQENDATHTAVVNFSLGAGAVPMSEEEQRIAMPAIEETIRLLHKGYKARA